MGLRLPRVFPASQTFKRIHMAGQTCDVPKGHLAIYVGEKEKRSFIVPISCLNHPTFRKFLSQVEEEFGFHHPMGGLTITRSEEAFLNLSLNLNGL